MANLQNLRPFSTDNSPWGLRLIEEWRLFSRKPLRENHLSNRLILPYLIVIPRRRKIQMRLKMRMYFKRVQNTNCHLSILTRSGQLVLEYHQLIDLQKRLLLVTHSWMDLMTAIQLIKMMAKHSYKLKRLHRENNSMSLHINIEKRSRLLMIQIHSNDRTIRNRRLLKRKNKKITIYLNKL